MMNSLPSGPLVAWYGDDFTGAAATMEVLTFAGFPSVLFLDPPTPEQMAKFQGMRGIGLAGTARSQTVDWMEQKLPQVFSWLKSIGAPVAHYKICSTFDSSPAIGSIGKAMDVAERYFEGWMPVLAAAPAMRRYQAFGNLFASSPSGVARLDRHPIMACHPVTPMQEADVRLVLAGQTKQPIGLISIEDLREAVSAQKALERERANGANIIALDTMSESDLIAAGQLIWNNAMPGSVAFGSQGIEYALVAHWRKIGQAAPARMISGVGTSKQMIAVSGSTSILTAMQIEHAAKSGFESIAMDATAGLGNKEAFGAAFDAALSALNAGRDALIYSAKGPDDASLASFRSAAEAAGFSHHMANQQLGETFGQLLATLLKRTKISRAAISGGDTSGHAAKQLGCYALTALAPTVPGASLCKAYSIDAGMDGLELALKGGQMGSEDYFDWIRQGGGER